MAGGAFAAQLPCWICAADGVVTRADRVYDGVEDDHYRCALGHGFGVDWSRGAPEKPQWPLSAAEVAAITARGAKGAEGGRGSDEGSGRGSGA